MQAPTPAANEWFSLSGITTAVSDPVNAITGEFYVNALDLKLNGPMPLEIRRIYGSLNQADNNFGHGWRMNYFLISCCRAMPFSMPPPIRR